MSKFCVYCGKELKDGEICQCDGRVSARAEELIREEIEKETNGSTVVEPPKAQKGFSSDETASDVFKIAFLTFQSFVKSPKTVANTFKKEGSTASAILVMGIHAILASIFFLFMGLSCQAVYSGASDIYDEIGSAICDNIPVVFCTTIFSSLLISFAVSATIYFISSKMENKPSFVECVRIASYRSFPALPITLAATILVLVNPILGLGVFATNALSVLFISDGIETYYTDRGAMKSEYIVAIVFLAVSILTSLFVASFISFVA